jgi:hypothetical protein
MCCTERCSGSRGTSRRRRSGRRCLFPDTPGRPGTSHRPRTPPVVLSTSVKPLQFARSSNVARLARVARTVQCHPHPHSAAPQQAANTTEELRPACSLLSNRSSCKADSTLNNNGLPAGAACLAPGPVRTPPGLTAGVLQCPRGRSSAP